MNKKLFGILGVFLLFAPFYAEQNNETVVLTIDDAVNYALQNNKTLKSADIDLEIKKRASNMSWNVFIPNVSVNGTVARSNSSSAPTINSAIDSVLRENIFWQTGSWDLYNSAKSQIIPREADELSHWATIGGLSVSWNFSVAYIAQIQSSKIAYEGQKITWEQNQKDTILNIKKLYYALFLQQENLKIQKSSLENARQRMLQAEANFKNGLIPEIQLLQTQVNYENTKPTVESAEMELQQQFDTFAFLLGLPIGTKIELNGSIEPVFFDANADELLAKYGQNDLDIKSLENNISAIKTGINALNFSTFIPAVAVSWGLQPTYTGDNAFAFWGDIGNGDKWKEANGNLSFTLAWNLTNMLPWSSNMQKTKDYKQNLRQLELNLEMLKENQKVQVKKAVDTLNLARQQIGNMDRSVELAQKAYDMQYKSYQNGSVELLELKDSENSLNQAKLGQLSQKYQYISALMDLENILNVNLIENK